MDTNAPPPMRFYSTAEDPESAPELREVTSEVEQLRRDYDEAMQLLRMCYLADDGEIMELIERSEKLLAARGYIGGEDVQPSDALTTIYSAPGPDTPGA